MQGAGITTVFDKTPILIDLDTVVTHHEAIKFGNFAILPNVEMINNQCEIFGTTVQIVRRVDQQVLMCYKFKMNGGYWSVKRCCVVNLVCTKNVCIEHGNYWSTVPNLCKDIRKWQCYFFSLLKRGTSVANTYFYKQRVLMHRHQGWNVRHGLCHIYMRYIYIYELFIAFVCFVVCSLL